MVYAFMEHGFHIYRGTCDQWQSLDTLQQFEAKGLDAETVSMDKTPEPYDICKTALYEGRLSAYYYKQWIDELKRMKRIVTKANKIKIDHPVDPKEGTCSKDVADAVAGVCIGLTMKPPGRWATGGDYQGPPAFLGGGDASDLVDMPERVEEDGAVPMPFIMGDSVDPGDEEM